MTKLHEMKLAVLRIKYGYEWPWGMVSPEAIEAERKVCDLLLKRGAVTVTDGQRRLLKAVREC